MGNNTVFTTRSIVIAMSLLFAGSHHAQEFYQSRGLELFNRGRYAAAVDTILVWIDSHAAESGIATYFVGESYYNMGLDAPDVQRARECLNLSVAYFEQALDRPDLSAVYPEKVGLAVYKRAWCRFRLAELEEERSLLREAYQDFQDVREESGDSVRVVARYMAGESLYRIAARLYEEGSVSENPGRRTELSQELILRLEESETIFRDVVSQPAAAAYLRTCARLRQEDIRFLRGCLYMSLSGEVFEQLEDDQKSGSARQTAIRLLTQVDYPSILEGVNQSVSALFEPAVRYSEASAAIRLLTLTGEDQERYRLNVALDGLRWAGYQAEKSLIMGHRDYTMDIGSAAFLQLAQADRSVYGAAGLELPEAWYWLGWTSFILDEYESVDHFQRFLDQTSRDSEVRIDYLRDDAVYRIFLLRFDRAAEDRQLLAALKGDVEAFQTRFPSIRKKLRLLLQLVRVGLGESIWREVLQGRTTSDRLDDAFLLIRNMLLRATRVTGRERVPYLNYLDNLFRITTDRRPLETMFYRGVSQFLRAEIQETAESKRNFYVTAADMLDDVEEPYRYEGMYVQARSYFSASNHATTPQRRDALYDRAKPIFIRLINEARSLRSLYYLGEIYRAEGNMAAARRCYSVVMQRTEGVENGRFWYNNAMAGMQTYGDRGDATVLDRVQIENVVFPERLLVVDDVDISLERFADPDYVRRQYWEEGLRLMIRYGRPKRELYPSAHAMLTSRFADDGFPDLTAEIRERTISVMSGLRLRIVLSEGSAQDLSVFLDDIAMNRHPEGYYEKTSLPLNRPVAIRVQSAFYYPYNDVHRFTHPGIEERTVFMNRRMVFQSVGTGTGPELTCFRFSQRLDRNVVMSRSGPAVPPSSQLYRDFQEDVKLRDFAYSELLDAYLATKSDSESLLLYRNDPSLSREDEFVLSLPESFTLKSPEGIAVDTEGRIFVVDWQSHRVIVFRGDGAYLYSFGGFGANTPDRAGQPVRFVYPTRIAVAEDVGGSVVDGRRLRRNPYLFVSDRNGVHLIDTRGTYWDTLKPPEIDTDALYGLEVVGYGSGSRLYLANRRTGTVHWYLARARAELPEEE